MIENKSVLFQVVASCLLSTRANDVKLGVNELSSILCLVSVYPWPVDDM